MSLSERLATATNPQPRFCKVGLILNGNQLTASEKTLLSDYLAVPEGASNRLTNSAIASALRAEGFDLSNSSVDRHRGAQCACWRNA